MANLDETHSSRTTATPRRDHRHDVTQQIITMIDQGTAPWQKPWSAQNSQDLRMPYNPVSGHRYKGGNALYLLSLGLERGYHDPRWCTLKQANSQGWTIRKGQTSSVVEYWKWDRRTDETDPATGETRRIEAARAAPKVFTARVFNAQQVDGMPPLAPPRDVPAWQAEASVERILSQSGAAIHHDQRDRAFYVPTPDRIHLPPKDAFASPQAYYATALHEIGHWTGHPARLNRDLGDTFGGERYAKEELRAEIASLFIAMETGIAPDERHVAQHAAYLDSWLKALRDDRHEIFRAASDAERIADYVLSLDRERVQSQTVGDTAGPAVGTPSADQAQARVHAAVESLHEVAHRTDAGQDLDHTLRDVTGTMAAQGRATGLPQQMRAAIGHAAELSEDKRDPEVHRHAMTQLASQRPELLAKAEAIVPVIHDAKRQAVEAEIRQQLGPDTRVYPAKIDYGQYKGQIVSVKHGYATQQVGRQSAILHSISALDRTPKVGERLNITYNHGQGHAKTLASRQQGRERGGRSL